MSQPAPSPAEDSGYQRSEEQIVSERAMGKVSDVLLNLDWTIEAARKGLKVVAKDGVNRNAELALADLIKELERARKRFVQDTYYAVGDRLI